ncbi:WSC2 [Candida jiufengensis]|uniref:WSC2 n=1 Tax=Candida jiufengensis TaxID=497108 RepID=UPI0022243626|nr:WSC2 [Candida jiufengensis]KAI5956891.1 WSC2 [Candida jiufengensis]
MTESIISINKITKKAIFIQLLFLITKVKSDSWSSLGCFKSSSLSNTQSQGTYTFQSSGWCQSQCSGKRIIGLTNGNQCYCGSTDPSNKVDDSNCNIDCQGYDKENCGGNGYFTVFVNSDASNEENNNDSSSSSSSSSSSTESSSPTTRSTSSQQPQTSTVKETTTAQPQTTSTTSSSSSSSTSPTTTSQTSSIQPTTVISTVVNSSNNGQQSVIYKTIIERPSTSSQDSSSSTTATSSSNTPSPTSSNPSSSSSTTTTTTSRNQSKGTSGGVIAGAVVGSVAGVAAIAALIFGWCWYRRRKSDDNDFDDQFTLSGPEKSSGNGGSNNGLNQMSQINDPNPFLLAGGYNHFDTSQQQTPRNQIQNSRTISSRNGSNGGGTATTAGAAAAFGHDHKYSSSGGTSNGIGGDSFGSHNDDYAFYDPDHQHIDTPNTHTQTNPGFLNSPDPEFGRRKLSNGSLPDMIAREPGSLKVVNN